MMPDVQPDWDRAVRKVFATGAVGAIKFRFPASAARPWMFSSRLIPEFADDGTVESVLSIASNITEQELIDAALRESKARLEFTLAAAHVGEWEIDVASGECRHSDLYDRCFGYAVPVPGWNLDMLFERVHADDRERVRTLATRAFETRQPTSTSTAASIWPDGSTHWIDVHGSPYVSARASEREPQRLRFLGIIADVTQRKHTEATLRDADLRKDEFLATLAHELRNPLAPIRNAVQIMQLSRDEAMHENARKIIERQLKQMVHLVDDLLDVSRISQGKVELRLEQVDVGDAVLDAIETSRPLIDAGRHHLTTRLAPPRALMVEADSTRAVPDRGQPAEQRGQVHARGRSHRGAGRARRRRGGDHGAGLGHRADARHAAARVRHVRAGRPLDGARAGRAGHRPRAGQAAGGDARRLGVGLQRRPRSRLPLRRAPAADPPSGAGAAARRRARARGRRRPTACACWWSTTTWTARTACRR